MKYYKDSNNELWVYEDYVEDEEIKEGLIAISEEEFIALTTSPPPTQQELLESSKKTKLEAIKTKRDTLLNAGLSYKEHTFQTTEKDKLNINGAVTNLMLDMQSGENRISEIIWIDSEDEKVRFSPQDFLIFASSVAFHTQEIIFKANALKKQVESAKTIEEVEAIVWDTIEEVDAIALDY